MIRFLHFVCLAVLVVTLLIWIVPAINTRNEWLFAVGAASLIGAVLSRLYLDQSGG